MRTLTSSYIALKNQLEGETVWAHLLDIEVNPSTTARFTSHPETLTFNGQTYMPVPFTIGVEEQTLGNELPQLMVNVSNFQGMALRFAKDNDLSLRNVTVRLVNTTLTASGDDARTRLQILGSIFANEVATFMLGHNFNFDAEGPIRSFNRRDFPSIPFEQRRFSIL